MKTRENDSMLSSTLQNDPVSRTMMRLLLLLQLSAMALVLGLIRFDRLWLALVVSFLTFFISAADILWLYLRYQKLPVVRQRRDLERLVLKFEKSVQTERNRIQDYTRERGQLFHAEKQELNAALWRLQRSHIEEGLARASIEQAAIPGLEPKMKERLALHGILSAAHVNDQTAELPGVGEARGQIILDWRSEVLAGLESTKPASLPDEQSEVIKGKYQALHDQNNAAERNAIASEQILEHELMSLKPRLRYLQSITFREYLRRSLASRGMVAALVAFVLIVTQLISSVSATLAFGTLQAAAFMAPLPASTSTVPFNPGATATPSRTRTPTVAPTSTITNTPTITFTPTITDTPQPALPASIASCVPRDTPREIALVVGIVDGDTIDVSMQDQIFRVRYIGIDTPERDQAFYSEAAFQNQTLVYNKVVTLVRDRSETDRFDRLLRYVIVGETFVNYELVSLGVAAASDFPPDSACAEAFETMQRQAQDAGRGRWIPAPAAFVPSPSAGGGGGTGNCDPAYPAVCIPPAPPDLDCKDISYRRFQVLPPDPHNFDGDADGMGCES